MSFVNLNSWPYFCQILAHVKLPQTQKQFCRLNLSLHCFLSLISSIYHSVLNQNGLFRFAYPPYGLSKFVQQGFSSKIVISSSRAVTAADYDRLTFGETFKFRPILKTSVDLRKPKALLSSLLLMTPRHSLFTTQKMPPCWQNSTICASQPSFVVFHPFFSRFLGFHYH